MTTPSIALQRLEVALMALPDSNRRALARAYHEHAAAHEEAGIREVWRAFVAVIDEAEVRATISEREFMILDPWSEDFDEVR